MTTSLLVVKAMQESSSYQCLYKKKYILSINSLEDQERKANISDANDKTRHEVMNSIS